jgi:hypothetical protein
MNYGYKSSGGMSSQQLLLNFGQVLDENPNAQASFYWRIVFTDSTMEEAMRPVLDALPFVSKLKYAEQPVPHACCHAC